ncbi:hypothetical protein ACVS4I_003061 [Vibrio fluvialis]
MSTSVSLTDAPANWVSAIGTAMAALGTVLTLGFLIYQNIELRRSQQEETLKREAHEEKQQNMWNEQREMLTFEKLKMHKQEFNALLDELEQRLEVKFFDRIKLYLSIFPKNQLQSPAIITKLSSTDMGGLEQAIKSHDKLLYLISYIRSHDLNDPDEVRISKEFIYESCNLRFYLHVDLPNNNYFGDITCGEDKDCFVITNVFSSLDSTSIYGEILRELLDFVGIVLNKTVLAGYFYNQPLYTFASHHNLHGGYNVNLGEVTNALSNIYYVMKINDRSKIRDEMLSNALMDVELMLESDLYHVTETQAAKQLKVVAETLMRALTISQSPEIRDKERCITLLQTAINNLNERIKFLN